MTPIRRTTPKGEDGSIAFAMLAVLVVGAIVLVLMQSVNVSQDTARFDREFNQSVHLADAGIQEAYAALAPLSDAQRPAIGATVSETDQPLGDGTYSWTATRVGDNYYHVRAVGKFGGVDRVLEAEVGERTLFPLAAFGDLLLEMRGGNGGGSTGNPPGATSYDENGNPTNNGQVGSNAQITLNGNLNVDWVRRFNSANYNGGGTVTQGVTVIPDEMAVPNLGAAAYTEDNGPCNGVDDGAYSGGPLTYGQTYCFTNVAFPGGVTNLSGNASDGPVKIYIAPGGKLQLLGQGSNGAVVNMQPANAPNATMLQIFVANGAVEANNHTKIAAGIYAPTSACTGSNAQSEVWGSIVCRTLDSRGGWSFFYDDRLADVTDQIFSIVGWREEVGGTTSFSSP